MSSLSKLVTLENPVFCSYAFWGSVLAVKVLAMSKLTVRQRFRKMVFVNPEDASLHGVEAKTDDPDVERVRRAHQNDLENILPFFFVGGLYVLTDPAPAVAKNLFRVIAVSRICHTIVYAIVPTPQPARFLAFTAAYGPTVFMAAQVLFTFASGF